MPVHFMLQKKGGVGKSYISSLFLQYLQEHDIPCKGIDIDPTTPTLSQIEGLKVHRLEIMRADENRDFVVNEDAFDELANIVTKNANNTHYLIDCGASGYTTMMSFLNAGNFIDFLQSMDIEVYIHTVIQGGNNAISSIESLSDLVKNFASVPFIVWNNGYSDELKFEHNGKGFEDSDFYKEYRSQIINIVNMPKYGFFSNDAEKMFSLRKTLQKIIKDGDFSIMKTHGLVVYRGNVWEKIDALMTQVESYQFYKNDTHLEDLQNMPTDKENEQ